MKYDYSFWYGETDWDKIYENKKAEDEKMNAETTEKQLEITDFAYYMVRSELGILCLLWKYPTSI